MASEFNNMATGEGGTGKQRMTPMGQAPGAKQNGPKAPASVGQALGGNRPETGGDPDGENLDLILDVPLQIAVELGRTRMLVNDLLKLGQGSVIELSKIAGETLDIMANQKLIDRGEVVVSNEKYGVRLTEIITPAERLERLR